MRNDNTLNSVHKNGYFSDVTYTLTLKISGITKVTQHRHVTYIKILRSMGRIELWIF